MGYDGSSRDSRTRSSRSHTCLVWGWNQGIHFPIDHSHSHPIHHPWRPRVEEVPWMEAIQDCEQALFFFFDFNISPFHSFKTLSPSSIQILHLSFMQDDELERSIQLNLQSLDTLPLSSFDFAKVVNCDQVEVACWISLYLLLIKLHTTVDIQTL